MCSYFFDGLYVCDIFIGFHTHYRTKKMGSENVSSELKVITKAIRSSNGISTLVALLKYSFLIHNTHTHTHTTQILQHTITMTCTHFHSFTLVSHFCIFVSELFSSVAFYLICIYFLLQTSDVIDECFGLKISNIN
jgi:hypothetical protein